MAKAAKQSPPHKFPVENKERLLSAERAQQLDPELLLSLLSLEPYHTVADIGCGPGFFTIPLALALPQGHLYALDTQAEMVKACSQLVRRAKAPNVEVLRSEENSLPLADASLDGAFVAFALHEVYDRSAFLSEVSRVLKPSGWLTIVEWVKEPMQQGPPLKERLSALDCLDLAEPLGYRLLDHALLNEQHYLVTFRFSERPAKRRAPKKATAPAKAVKGAAPPAQSAKILKAISAAAAKGDTQAVLRLNRELAAAAKEKAPPGARRKR